MEGIELLDAAMAHIEENPRSWDQSRWVFRDDVSAEEPVTACLGGRIMLLSGRYRPVWDGLVAWHCVPVYATDEANSVGIGRVAADLLGVGVSSDEARRMGSDVLGTLFGYMGNNLDGLKANVDGFKVLYQEYVDSKPQVTDQIGKS